MKICTKCKEEKPLDQFSRDKSKRDGRHTRCKVCRGAKDREYHAANRERISAYQKKWWAENRESQAEYTKRRYEEFRVVVFEHFGATCSECSSINDLTLDHVNGDGKEHRQLLKERGVGGRQTGWPFYKYLIDNDFDTDGYELEVLCWPCHMKKSAKERRKAA